MTLTSQVLPPEPTDERLMRRFVETLDDEPFRQLVERHRASALALACGRLRDRALAEDAVQEAFIRVVRGRRRYDPVRPFLPWFHALLRNACADQQRGAFRHARRRQALAEESRGAAVSPAPVAEAGDWMGALPESDRELLTMRFLQGFSIVDMAARYRCSVEAMKKRAQRALQRVRELSAAR